MAKLKPYIFTTQSFPSISNRTFPFPISKLNIDSRLCNLKPFLISQSHPPPKPQQIIVCAKKQQWSNQKILQLASKVAFNLKILPEPFNSFLGQIARSNSNENRILNNLIGGVRLKSNKKRSGKKFLLPVFVLICVAGLWSWRISELDLFLSSLFCMIGISSISLLLRNKAIKNWFLGFLFGVVLMMSLKLGKDDVKFWVEKVRTCSPVAQIVMGNKNRKWRISK